MALADHANRRADFPSDPVADMGYAIAMMLMLEQHIAQKQDPGLVVHSGFCSAKLRAHVVGAESLD